MKPSAVRCIFILQAVVFMGIVGVFLLCHVPRVLLNMHETWVWDEAMGCMNRGKPGFPMWATLMVTLR